MIFSPLEQCPMDGQSFSWVFQTLGLLVNEGAGEKGGDAAGG